MRARRRRSGAAGGPLERWAAAVLLLGAGVALLLVAMRLVAAAFSCSFSPFDYLPLPAGHAWRVLLLVLVAAACAGLLPLVLRRDGHALYLEGERGGVLIPARRLETLLRDQTLGHAEVVKADVTVTVRRAVPHAVLSVALRPLVAGDAVAAELAAAARARLAAVTGLPEVGVRVRHRVLSVHGLGKELP